MHGSEPPFAKGDIVVCSGHYPKLVDREFTVGEVKPDEENENVWWVAFKGDPQAFYFASEFEPRS